MKILSSSGITPQTRDHQDQEVEGQVINHQGNCSIRKTSVEVLVRAITDKTLPHLNKTKVMSFKKDRIFRASHMGFKVMTLVTKVMTVKVTVHGVRVISSFLRITIVTSTAGKDLDLKVIKGSSLVLLVMVSMETIKVRVSMDSKVKKLAFIR